MAQPRRRAQATKRARTRILVVEARYYDDIADALLAGASRALKAAGAEFDLVTVRGALEIPAAIAIGIDGAKKSKRYDAAIALGCVIRGETFHFEIVATQSARALIDMSVDRAFPIGNGILTVESEEQAIARAGDGDDNKGAEAVMAALSLVDLKRSVAR